MKTTKLASMILGSLFLFLAALAARAQQADWVKLTADAKAARQSGNFSDSATLYKQALGIQEQTFGPESQEVATTLNNLAVLYQDQSNDAEAEPLYRRSLSIWEKNAGSPMQIAASMNNLAALFHDERK